MLTPQGFYQPTPRHVAPGDPPSPAEVTGWRIEVSRGPLGMMATLTERYHRRLPDRLVGAQGTLQRRKTGDVERVEVELGALTMTAVPCGHATCGLTWLLVEVLGTLAQGTQCGGVEMAEPADDASSMAACCEDAMDPLW